MAVNQAQLEIKLREHGFTEKNIMFLKSRQQRSGMDFTSLESLLVELRKRFYGACALVILLLAFTTYVTLARDTGNGFIYFGFSLLCCVYVLGITPVGIAWKAVRFLSKNK